MKTRTWVWVVAAGLVWSGVSGRAAAGGSAIAESMGDLRWGMTESEVAGFAKRLIGDGYAELLKKADAAKKTKLRDAMKHAQADVEKSRVAFEGSKSRWDSSPIAGEFNYGDDESMLVAKEERAQHYFFFRDGRLWKWYKAVDQGTFGHGGFKKFANSLEQTFGKGRSKKGALNPSIGETQWVEYLDRTSRLRGADASKRGVYALIFEDMSVVRELAASKPKPSRAVEEEPEAATAKTAKSRPNASQGEVASAGSKRSVFASEREGESEADYQSRKARETSESRDRQARARARKEDAKQGEVLKQLDGIDDKDPLGGL